ncbi:MAG: hypothetical protein GX028_02515 [Clostridiaceae bacterium]|nr:hypothetical protein [Clostridiaceae bacterium]
MKINMDKPATRWAEGFPLGNGFFGAMVYGGTYDETVDLSASTWFSGNSDWDNNCPDTGAEVFSKMRKEAINNNFSVVRELTADYMGSRLNYGTNLPLAQLKITDINKLTSENERTNEGYNRSLDLQTGLCSVDWQNSQDGNTAQINRREYFVSHVDRVIAMRVVGSNMLPDMEISLSGEGLRTLSFSNTDITYMPDYSASCNLIVGASARESMHSDGTTGANGIISIKILSKDGQISFDNKCNNIMLSDSRECILLLTFASDLEQNSELLQTFCTNTLDQAAKLGWKKLLTRHIEDFSPAMERVHLKLGRIADWNKPADKSVHELAASTDEDEKQGLTALLFQFGRYLLHSSSRSDSPLPAHLQGIWNDSVASRIGWTCDMHLDINTQMNYWPAEITALSESTDPLLDWIENILVPSGHITARKCYGLDGWAAELVSNAWGFSAPYWSPNLSPCPTGGAWLIQQLWQRYLFNQDDQELQNRIMPIIYEAALFLSQYLFEIPGEPYLQSGPSISPENTFVVDGGSYQASLSPVYEIAVIRDIFQSYLEASKVSAILEPGDDRYQKLAHTIEQQLEKLPPYRIAEDGTLSEWSHDYPAADSQHRHTSHLLGLYPYMQITPEETPELAAAAQATIDKRLTPADNWEDTGWSRSLLMLYSASLKKGNQAYEHINSMLSNLLQEALLVKHPPTRGAPAFDDVYEMDGNTGLTTCIAHMLLQSPERGVIELLPALPTAWQEGSVSGLRAAGGLEFDIEWENGCLQHAEIVSRCDQKIRVLYNGNVVMVELDAGLLYTLRL